MSWISAIPTLNGTNYKQWREKLELALVWSNDDFALSTPRPVEPVELEREANETDVVFATRQKNHEDEVAKIQLAKRQWDHANKKCLTLAKATIAEPIRGSIPESDTATEYLERVKNQFYGTSKTQASSLIRELLTKKYTGGGVREHILKMSTLAAKLASMKMVLPDPFVIHVVLASLPKEFETFVVNYNMLPDEWNIEKLIGMCAQEEDRIKGSQGDSVHFVKDNKKKFFHKNAKPQGKPKWDGSSSSKGKAPMAHQTENKPQHKPQSQMAKRAFLDPEQCLFCTEWGHKQANCPGFLKWCLKKGEDTITLVDESLFISYAKSTWWIDSGATIHVANSLQGFSSRRTLQRGERRIKVANGLHADAEAIGDLSLELLDGFVLRLSDVLYIPSLRRNLISVSKLDDDGLSCHFGDGMCKIHFRDKCVGLAFRQDQLYLLSVSENVNVISTECQNASSSTNVSRKRKKFQNDSSKLWHCRLGHISRGEN